MASESGRPQEGEVVTQLAGASGIWILTHNTPLTRRTGFPSSGHFFIPSLRLIADPLHFFLYLQWPLMFLSYEASPCKCRTLRVREGLLTLWSWLRSACMLIHVWLFVTPWTVTHQAPLSMGFSRWECWSGLPFPSLGDLPDPGIGPGSPESPALQADPLQLEPSGKPTLWPQVSWSSGPA